MRLELVVNALNSVSRKVETQPELKVGDGPAIVRAMALNVRMLASYDQAACSLPFNYVKTQIQKMQPDAEISTLALLTVLSKPPKQEDPSNFTPDSLSIVSGLLLVS
ncbi:hypothetical protein KIW84_010220 [Lathyrus oleraceus]|uniref:Uncharacterized protein n=1 Tax=Pisum sativum TaxID=3888 RepID=A0A9D4YNM4_PEA|nr:hypothetical protein KIW84_010219 [Pisum sativum]KAI5440655.1 hypothetical protein KIW84_010220 [Pisum sativum]